MRLIGSAILLFAVAGVVTAQDTNFSTGPQYLITTDSMLLHPISTPSLNLDAPLPPLPSLPDIGQPVEDQPYIPNPELTKQADLLPIYYGYPSVSVVELTSPEITPELPSSITDAGVEGFVDPQTLRTLGYGVPIGDTAAYWKAHTPRTPRIYSNADVQRLHPN